MKLLLNNHEGDTQVSKHMQERCYNWFRLAFAAEKENRDDLKSLSSDMLSVQFGTAKRKDRIALYKVQNGTCNLCGQRLPVQLFAIDHIDAKSKTNNNRLDNFQVLCSACNSWKGDRPMHKMRDLRRKQDLPVYEAVYYGQSNAEQSPVAPATNHVQTNGSHAKKDWEFVERVVLENGKKEMSAAEVADVCIKRNMWGSRGVEVPKYPVAGIQIALRRACGLKPREGTPISEEAFRKAKVKQITKGNLLHYTTKN